MRLAIVFLTFVLLIEAPSAQSPTARSEAASAFEIASVHVSVPRATSRRAPAFRGNRFEAVGQTLPTLIAFAYGVNANRVVGGPNWLDFDRFDIAAKVPSGASPAAQRRMLQTLLADRFALTVHDENRPQEAWALVNRFSISIH